jgi:hypothetical protein
MTTLIIEKNQWKLVRDRVENDHGKNFFLISWRVKRELGFTVRTYFFYDKNKERTSDIRLDFDEPACATYFQLKYL